jgi:hypothetical protein
LALAVAGGLSCGCPASGAVDRDDRRPIRFDTFDNGPSVQLTRKHYDPTIIDERDVEALALPSDIHTEPSSHAAKYGTRARSSSVQSRSTSNT